MKKFEQLLIFKIGHCKYSIDSDLIVQILRVPEITKLPFAPKSIRGLCSIEGHIIPAFDMLALICNEDNFIDLNNLKARVLTVRVKDYNLALIVDEVVQNIDIGDSKIEDSDSSNDGTICGIFKNAGEIIQVINVEILLAKINIEQFANRKSIPNKTSKTEVKLENADFRKYLLFNMSDEVFGIEIDLIREIIVNTRAITPIANSNRDVLGMITLRDEVLIILDFRVHFDKYTPATDKNRILVIKAEGSHVGILIDNILDIKDIPFNSIERLAEKFRDRKVSGVVNLDEFLASIINNSYLREIASKTSGYIQSDAIESLSSESENLALVEVAIFTISSKEYAIDIDSVDEIIRYDNLTKLPRVSEYLKGIINLRGEVIPILSLQKRLGFVERIIEDSKILICKIDSSRVGFLVDNVAEIKEISPKNIKQSDEKSKLFSSVILLDKGERIILKLNTKNLFNFKDVNELLERV